VQEFRLTVPIGHLLVEQGVLTEEQCRDILEVQETSGRPFGVIAEEMFGVAAGAVESAWADQYSMMAEWVDPCSARVDQAAAALIDRRQAWQFRILPMSLRGDQLRVCTTRDHLVRALSFATSHFTPTCYFVLANPEDLGRALMRYMPMDGMSADMVNDPSVNTVRDAA